MPQTVLLNVCWENLIFRGPACAIRTRHSKSLARATENIDKYKRAVRVVALGSGNPLKEISLSEKRVQRPRREFRKHSVEAFEDKRHNNAPVNFTKVQRNEVIATLMATTQNDHGHTNSGFWSKRILATVMTDSYGVVYAPLTCYLCPLQKASFSFHLPDKKYLKADPKVVPDWRYGH